MRFIGHSPNAFALTPAAYRFIRPPCVVMSPSAASRPGQPLKNPPGADESYRLARSYLQTQVHRRQDMKQSTVTTPPDEEEVREIWSAGWPALRVCYYWSHSQDLDAPQAASPGLITQPFGVSLPHACGPTCAAKRFICPSHRVITPSAASRPGTALERHLREPLNRCDSPNHVPSLRKPGDSRPAHRACLLPFSREQRELPPCLPPACRSPQRNCN
jgi:hypothetical protein